MYDYDDIPPLDGGYNIGISAYRKNYNTYTPIFGNPSKIPNSNPVDISPYNSSYKYLNKKSSNIRYKQVKYNKRIGVRYYDVVGHRLPINDYDVQHLSFNDFVYEYESQELNPILPFHNIQVRLSPATVSRLRAINNGIYDAIDYTDVRVRRYQDVASMYGGSNNWANEIRENFKRFLLAFIRTAMRAGVPCEQILSDVRTSFHLSGLNDKTFLDACKDEKGLEIQRVAYGNAKVSNCCLSFSFNPIEYKKDGESFEQYINRAGDVQKFKNHFEFNF